MSASIHERVARGAAWLEETRPGWRDQISLDRIDLCSNDRCILGQVYAGTEADKTGFHAGVREMHRTLNPDLCNPSVHIDDLGFNASRHGSFELAATRAETAALEAEWRRVIHAPMAAERVTRDEVVNA